MALVSIKKKPYRKLGVFFTQDVQNKLVIGLKKAGEEIGREMKTVFIGQGIRDGEGKLWQKTSLIALRKRKNPSRRKKGSPTLRDTDKYFQSFGFIQIIVSRNRVTVETGSSDEQKTITHEEGRKFDFGEGLKIIPIRSANFITRADKKRIDIHIKKAFDG